MEENSKAISHSGSGYFDYPGSVRSSIADTIRLAGDKITCTGTAMASAMDSTIESST
jgi:hypothetical protein